jgi:putative hydroxymethylpyrimidine transport system substrate-binding protein
MMSFLRGKIGVLLVAVLVAGCGGGGDEGTAETRSQRPEKLREFAVTLDGYAGPETMGLLMADELGYFEEVGLDVSFSLPLYPVRPVNYVDQQIVDMAVSHEPQVVLARERGVPLVAVGSLVERPTAAMIWLKKSKIDGIADLKGKTIAIPGLSFQGGFLQSLLAQAGLTPADVKIERVDYGLLSALIGGQADAIFGGSWNVEGIELETRGLEPVITRVESLGVPSYDELVLIAHRNRLSKDPQSIRDFMSALARGTAAAREEDPKAVTEAILAVSEKSNRKATQAQVEATLPLLSQDGQMNPAQARGLIEWMREEQLIQEVPPVSSLLTNRYLALQP